MSAPTVPPTSQRAQRRAAREAAAGPAAPPPATPLGAATKLDLGRPIKGPTALGDDWRRFVVLTRALAVTDFKLRFYGSVLGYLWSLMRPFLLFGILFLVFAIVLNFGDDLAYYPAALLLGIVMHSFINEAMTGAVPSLVTRENLVRKIDFPRLAVPLAAVTTAAFSLITNLFPVFVFLFALGGGVSVSWIELPILLACLVFFTTGACMLASATYVRYRDVQPITDVVLQALFYATPIFWSVNTLVDKPHWVQVVVFSNPFAAILEQARHSVISSKYPSAAYAIGGAEYLVIPVAISVGLFAFGYRVFAKQAPRVAEDL